MEPWHSMGRIFVKSHKLSVPVLPEIIQQIKGGPEFYAHKDSG